jgi:threonine-phosphate decarboxylase
MNCETPNTVDNIYRLAEELKIPERRVIDFSTPSNPLGVSKKIKAELRKHLKYLHNVPDPEAKRLRKQIGKYHRADPEMVLCGSDRMELLSLTVRAMRPGRVLIAGPYDSEYEKACSLSGAEVAWYDARDKNSLAIDADDFVSFFTSHALSMIVLGNPGGLTGISLKKEDVQKIAEAARELKCRLIIDEAFMDFCPENSVVGEVMGNPFLIVLRTMSFFYALAGLRIAYGIFPRDIVESIRAVQGPCTVNSLAQRAAVIALKDAVYRKETSLIIRREKQFLERGFRKLGIDFLGSDVNFYLLKMGRAAEVCQRLRKKGLLLGYFSYNKGPDIIYLRAAVKTHKANAGLIKELSRFLQEQNSTIVQ